MLSKYRAWIGVGKGGGGWGCTSAKPPLIAIAGVLIGLAALGVTGIIVFAGAFVLAATAAATTTAAAATAAAVAWGRGARGGTGGRRRGG